MKAIARRVERARAYRNDGGFTLVEMIITIVIVGMITGSMVLAFSMSIKTSTSSNDRLKKSNTAQVITRFLVPDAASAGGFDDQNRTINEAGLKPGVYIQPTTTGFCDVTGSVLRFEWVARTPGVTTRVASNYSLVGTDLVRTYCTQGITPAGSPTSSSITLGNKITGVTPTCIPSCAPSGAVPLNPPPVIVTLTVASAPAPSPSADYTFSASGFVRAGGSSGTPTSATVPLIALGITGTPCPTMRGGSGNNATAQVQASGVAVAEPKTSASSGNPADPFEPKITVFGVAAINSNATSTPCGPAGNITLPTGWFATQTLVVSPGTCTNCGSGLISIPAPINDPFANLAPPIHPACTSGGSNPATTVVGNERHYFPGVYHQPVNLVITSSGGRQIDQYIFENTTNGGAGTGVYVFCRGMTIQSGILAQSKPGGVLFYFEQPVSSSNGSSLRRIIPGAGGGDDFSDINWQIDGRPEWRDIVLWQSNPTTGSATTTGDMEIAIGENDPISHPLSARYGGVIYAPRAQVEFYLPTRETLGQYGTVEATAAAVVARNIVADRISRIRLGDGPQTTVALTANPNPSTVGQPVTLQATISPVFPATGTATGVVTFYDDSEQLGTATMINGVATFVTATLGGGARPLKAIYSGDLVFASSVSPTLNTVLNPAPSTTTLTSNSNPAGTGQPVTFTATVAGVGGGPIPTGTVTFYDDVVPLGSVALSLGGVATLSQTLNEGLHPIRAVYNGDVSYLISTSNVVQQAVKQASVAVLTSSPNPTNAGEQVLLTATVAPLNPSLPATGTVTFFDGTVQVGGGAVVLDGNGVATLNVSNFTGGNHQLTVRYSGDMLLAPSTSSVHIHIVNFAGGAVGLTSNVNPSALNQSVTFTATVTGQVGLPVPTGSIQFYDGASPIGGPVTLNGAGVATRTTTTLQLGSRSITAFYNGDANYLSATSPAVTQLVQAGTTTTLTSNRLPSGDWGQTVTFTATVTESAPGNPTGNVEFHENGQLLGQVPLTGTIAVLTTSATWFDVGTHPIIATFVPGDASFTGSSSAVLSQIINLATTTLSLTSSPNPSAPDQTFTITATLTESAPGTPIGTVYFYDNNVFFGQGTVVNGVASFTTSFPANPLCTSPCNHPVTAYYPATGNFQASTYFTLNQVVQTIPTSVVVSSSANPATPGQTVTLRADITASAPNPTGLVEFWEGSVFLGSGGVGANYAVLVVNGFSIGNHPITAIYQATGNFTSATSPVFNQVAGLISTTLNVTSNLNPAAVGAPITFTGTVTAAVGTPTGIVFFYDNNSVNIGQGTVNGAGVATMTINTLTAGNHPITATFQGTGNYANSSFLTLNQFVGAVATTLNVTSNVNPSTPGQSVTFTVTVTSAVGTPTGQVFLYDNNVNFGPAITLVNGTGTLTTTTFDPMQPLVGTHPITGFFQATGAYQNSSFFTIQQRVGNPTTISLARTTGNSPSILGQPVAFTATVSDSVAAVPTGNVRFFNNGVLIGTQALNAGTPDIAVLSPSLAVGTHSITAIYDGDGNFLPSTFSAAVGQTVGPVPPPDLLSVTPADIIRPATNVLVTLTGTGFQNGATVTITTPTGQSCTNGVTIVAGSTTFVSATQVTVLVNVSSTASQSSACTRIVRITNPDALFDTLSAIDID